MRCKYGFIETPYRRVDWNTLIKVTDKIDYLTADEDSFVVAQANSPLNEDRKLRERCCYGALRISKLRSAGRPRGPHGRSPKQ